MQPTQETKNCTYLSCIEEIIPQYFAYDRQNYTRYLIPFLNDMLRLPSSMPEVYSAFLNEEFFGTDGRSKPFWSNEADKTVEKINRDCKTGGGYISFSDNFAATQRWVLHAFRRGTYGKLLREHLSSKPPNYVHKELAPGRIKKDTTKAVEKGINLLENVFTNPWNGGDLTSLSTGIEATAEVKDSLLGAKDGEFAACLEFISSRCSSSPKLDFFDPLPKSKYKTFKDLKKVVKVSGNDRVLPFENGLDFICNNSFIGKVQKN